MKKNAFYLVPLAMAFLMLTAFENNVKFQAPAGSPGNEFSIPEDVNTILDKSCFGCHNVDAKSDKSKKKLMIDKLGELSAAKLVGKLGDISEVVASKDMPPEKFLTKYPDKALTEEEAKRLIEWADQTAEELMK